MNTGELTTTNNATTIGARRNHLNFALPDISPSIIWKDQAILCQLAGIGKVGAGVRQGGIMHG